MHKYLNNENKVNHIEKGTIKVLDDNQNINNTVEIKNKRSV